MTQFLRKLMFAVMALFAISAIAQADLPVYDNLISSPKQGATVSVLEYVELFYADGKNIMNREIGETATVKNAEGVEVSKIKSATNTNPADGKTNTKSLYFLLETPIKDAGTYTLNIPGKFFSYGFSKAYSDDPVLLTFTVDPNFVPAEPVLDKLYFVGQPSGWVTPDAANAEHYANWALTETSEGSRIYEGSFEIPAGEAMFRFYDDLEGWEKHSYGCQEVDDPIKYNLSSDKFKGTLVSGKGSFEFPVWYGGKMTFSVNLNALTFEIKAERSEVNCPNFYVSGTSVGETANDANTLKYYGEPDEDGYFAYSAILTGLNGEFKISSTDGSVVFGGDKLVLTNGVEADVKLNGNNATFKTECEKISVDFRYNPNTAAASKLTVTEVYPLTLVSSTPADGGSSAMVNVIYLDFNENVKNVIDGEWYESFETGEGYYTSYNFTLTDSEGKTNDPNDEKAPYGISVSTDWFDTKRVLVNVGDVNGKPLPLGSYTLEVKAGAIRAANGTTNEDLKISFTVREVLKTTITPAAGAVESLSEIVLDNADGIYATGKAAKLCDADGVVLQDNLLGEMFMLDAATGEYVAYDSNSDVFPTRIVIKLKETVTAPGTYIVKFDKEFAFSMASGAYIALPAQTYTVGQTSTFKLESTNPQEGEYVVNCESIQITFNEHVDYSLAADASAALVNGNGDKVMIDNFMSGSMFGPGFESKDYSVYVYPKVKLPVGEYTLTIAAGSVVSMKGEVYNEEIVLHFGVREPAKTIITPSADKPVDSFKEIKISNEDGIYYLAPYMEMGYGVLYYIEVADDPATEANEEVAVVVENELQVSTEEATCLTIVLKEEQTKKGTYRLHLPECYYQEKLDEVVSVALDHEIIVKEPTLGVESVAVDAAEAVYYTLQGVKVESETLVPGIYVKIVGNKVGKVVVK